MTMKALAIEWTEAKEAERLAIERRRSIEDQLKKSLKISEQDEGTISHKEDNVTIKAVCRINYKVDSDMLLLVAGQNGYADKLAELFRWEPKINKTAWKQADPKMTQILSAAITAEPGRPTFLVTTGE